MAGKVKKFFKWSGIVVGAGLVLGGAFGAHEWYADKPFFANNFYNRAFLKFMLESPEGLTAMGLLEQIPLLDIDGHNAEWDDNSLAAEERQFELLQDVMASMALYTDDELSDQELITKRIIMELLGDPVQQRKFRFHNYPVNQLFGLQNQIPRFLDGFHQVNDEEDAEHYISRLSKIDTKMEQNMEGILVREELGIIPPTFVIDKSLEIMQDFGQFFGPVLGVNSKGDRQSALLYA